MEQWLKDGRLDVIPRQRTVEILDGYGLKIQTHQHDLPIVTMFRDRTQLEIHCDMAADLRASQMADLIEALHASDIRIYASSHDPYDDSPFRTWVTIYVPACLISELCHTAEESGEMLAARMSSRQRSNKQHAIEIAKRAGLTPEDLA